MVPLTKRVWDKSDLRLPLLVKLDYMQKIQIAVEMICAWDVCAARSKSHSVADFFQEDTSFIKCQIEVQSLIKSSKTGFLNPVILAAVQQVVFTWDVYLLGKKTCWTAELVWPNPARG